MGFFVKANIYKKRPLQAALILIFYSNYFLKESETINSLVPCVQE